MTKDKRKPATAGTVTGGAPNGAHEIFTYFEDSTNGGGMQEGVR